MIYLFRSLLVCNLRMLASDVARPWGCEDRKMENNEVEVKKVGPIVETVWGILLLVTSFALIFIGA